MRSSFLFPIIFLIVGAMLDKLEVPSGEDLGGFILYTQKLINTSDVGRFFQDGFTYTICENGTVFGRDEYIAKCRKEGPECFKLKVNWEIYYGDDFWIIDCTWDDCKAVKSENSSTVSENDKYKHYKFVSAQEGECGWKGFEIHYDDDDAKVEVLSGFILNTQKLMNTSDVGRFFQDGFTYHVCETGTVFGRDEYIAKCRKEGPECFKHKVGWLINYGKYFWIIECMWDDCKVVKSENIPTVSENDKYKHYTFVCAQEGECYDD